VAENHHVGATKPPEQRHAAITQADTKPCCLAHGLHWRSRGLEAKTMKRQDIKWMYRSVLTAAFIIAEALVPAAVALGQSADQEEDGPGRGVARISLLNGDVSVRRGDSGDWITAAVNGPLLADDRVLSGPGARAEVQLDYYDRIRLGSDTEVRFPELEWRKYQVQVARGTVIFSALPGTNDQIEFATPAASLRPLSAGSYRMSVMEDGTAEFTVRRGEAEIYTPHGTRRLTPGRTMRVHLSPDNVPEFQVSYEVPRDSFDQFSEQRDQELQRSKSYQYVSRDVDGAEDLDGAGEWVNQAPYGWSWRPYVAPDWAPYREGRWVWADDSYGWTWLSYDPWGWAPYHYGRWFCNAGAWYWYPGAFGGRHYWRPGLVAFFGYGGFGVGIGFGGFGWVPLAPFETYHPWYGHGGYRYHEMRNVNIMNNYRNARVGNGVSGVNARDFGRGGAVRAVPVAARDLGNANVMRGALPINPSRGSLRMSDRPVSGSLAARAAQSGNGRFIASRSAPSSNRTPFESRAGGIQSLASSGSAAGFNRNGAPQSTAARGAGQGTAGGLARSTSQNGWTRMDNQSRASSGRSPATAGSGSSQPYTSPARGGWGSFGTPAGGRNTSGDSALSTRGSGQNSTASQRGGWTSFGSPERGTSSSTQSGRGGWSTGGSSGGVRVYGQSESPSRGSWSTGGSNGGGSGYGRYESPSRGGSGGWSSGGSSSPNYSAPARSSAPHYSSSPSGGGASRQSAPAPSRSGGGGGGSRSGGGHSSRR
jgi:hypothetical protein